MEQMIRGRRAFGPVLAPYSNSDNILSAIQRLSRRPPLQLSINEIAETFKVKASFHNSPCLGKSLWNLIPSVVSAQCLALLLRWEIRQLRMRLIQWLEPPRNARELAYF